MAHYTPNLDWDIIGFKGEVSIENFKMNSSSSSHIFKLHFILQRHGAGVRVVYIAPAVGMNSHK